MAFFAIGYIGLGLTTDKVAAWLKKELMKHLRTKRSMRRPRQIETHAERRGRIADAVIDPRTTGEYRGSSGSRALGKGICSAAQEFHGGH